MIETPVPEALKQLSPRKLVCISKTIPGCMEMWVHALLLFFIGGPMHGKLDIFLEQLCMPSGRQSYFSTKQTGALLLISHTVQPSIEITHLLKPNAQIWNRMHYAFLVYQFSTIHIYPTQLVDDPLLALADLKKLS